MKPLVLSYEMTWRTKVDEKFSKSTEWKSIRQNILARDNSTCQYCGYMSESRMQVNHIDGNPKNNNLTNLEVVCTLCHMVMHSGLWAAVKKTMILFKESKYSQNEIIRITRDLRSKGANDDEIIECLGLRNRVEWRQDIEYLSKLYGFITSNKSSGSGQKPFLTEEEQRRRIEKRRRK